MPKWTALLEAAAAARKSAHAPYSNFMVGAAIECDDGSIVSGCNVENASYGLTVCAERNAVGQMIKEGKRPVAVAIVTGGDKATPPCGACRQVLAEFSQPSLPIRSQTGSGKKAEYTLAEVLPHAFTEEWLARPGSKRGKADNK